MYQSYKTLYLSQGVNLRNNSLESSTDMCGVVDCLDVFQDPDKLYGRYQEIRTVPVMCPGEWANNLTIDGLGIEDIAYIGEPFGLSSSHPKFLYEYVRFREKKIRTWIYDGKIMGGLAPWWHPRGYRLAALEGKIVDKNTGQYIDTEPHILPYYHKENNSYYLPAEKSQHIGGWISGSPAKNC